MPIADFFHILNPNQTRRPEVEKFFEPVPADSYFWVERTSHPTHLETLVEWAVNGGRRRIAVWGGDGTLSRVVQKLVELGALEKTTLALVPVGTANDFSRKVGSSFKIGDSGFWDVARAKEFDLGFVEANGVQRVFVNNSGFGRTAPALKKERPNAWRDIAAFREKKLDLKWTGKSGRQSKTFAAFLGIVFNAPYFNKGMHFDANIEPDDGLLTAFFVPPMGRLPLLAKLVSARLGRPMADGRMPRIEGTEIALDSNDDLFPQVDGEPAFGNAGIRNLKYSIRPAALRMVC